MKRVGFRFATLLYRRTFGKSRALSTDLSPSPTIVFPSIQTPSSSQGMSQDPEKSKQTNVDRELGRASKSPSHGFGKVSRALRPLNILQPLLTAAIDLPTLGYQATQLAAG